MYNVQFTIRLILLLFTFYILHFTFYIFPAYAQADAVGQARIHPASPLYFLKSIRENLELKFAGTTNIKALRQIEFSTRRIREVKSLVSVSRADLILPTLERYSWHLQEIANLLSPLDSGFAGKAAGEIVLQMSTLQTVYDQISNPNARMSIRLAISRLSEWEGKFIDKISQMHPLVANELNISKLSACTFLSKEASSSALNEVERMVYSERAQKCQTVKQ